MSEFLRLTLTPAWMPSLILCKLSKSAEVSKTWNMMHGQNIIRRNIRSM